MWPCSCCKTTTPIMLGWVGMMGAVMWQQLQSHTGCATLLSPNKSVAHPVALQQQIPPLQCQQQVSLWQCIIHWCCRLQCPHHYEGHSADSSVITVFCRRKIRWRTIVSCWINCNCGKMLKQKRISASKDVIKYFTTFFASNFFSYFPPLKPMCVLWSSASHSPKNMVSQNKSETTWKEH